MARIATLNWEIPIGIPGLVFFWGVFRNQGHMAAFLGVWVSLERFSKTPGSLNQPNRYRSPVSMAISWKIPYWRYGLLYGHGISPAHWPQK